MKLATLFCSLSLCSCAFGSTVFERPLSEGMDNAVISAFAEASGTIMESDLRTIPLDDVRKTISLLRINGDNLEISFDDEKLSSLMKSRGIAAFTGLDSPVLIWLADTTKESMPVVGSDSGDDFAKALISSADALKYKLLLPVMDLDDVGLVNAQTIVSHSDDNLKKASSRYDVKYFVAGVLGSDGAQNSFNTKWNVFDAEGNLLGNGQNSGDLGACSETMSKDIAMVIARKLSGTSAGSAGNTTISDVYSSDPSAGSSIVLGPVKGGVRVQISGIENVADYPRIKNTLITYGYESDIQVLGYSNNGVIFLIPTSSSPAILDGTFSHASEFTKTGEWTYRYNQSQGSVGVSSEVGRIGQGSASRVTSSIKEFGDTAYTRDTVRQNVEVKSDKDGNSTDSIPVITFTDDSDSSSIPLERN